jgi:hypothetical protein
MDAITFVTVTLKVTGDKRPETIQELAKRATGWEIHRIGELAPAKVVFPAESTRKGFDEFYTSTIGGG